MCYNNKKIIHGEFRLFPHCEQNREKPETSTVDREKFLHCDKTCEFDAVRGDRDSESCPNHCDAAHRESTVK